MKYLHVRKLQIVTFAAAILILAIIAGAARIHTTKTLQWEYARIQFDPFTEWLWSEPAGTIREEKLEEIFRKLSIPIPQNSEPNLYLFMQWAGEQGWELVDFQKTRGRFTAWFKRPQI